MNQGYSSSGRQGMNQPGYAQPVYGQPGYGQPGQPGYGNPAGVQQTMGPPSHGQQQSPVTNQAQPQVVTVVSGQEFKTVPVSITCQFCKNPVTTIVEKKCSCSSCCLCCWTGLLIWICIQACRNKEIGCNDATHKCPSCGNILGHYESC